MTRCGRTIGREVCITRMDPTGDIENGVTRDRGLRRGSANQLLSRAEQTFHVTLGFLTLLPMVLLYLTLYNPNVFHVSMAL